MEAGVSGKRDVRLIVSAVGRTTIALAGAIPVAVGLIGLAIYLRWSAARPRLEPETASAG
jgi:hypothetical protein